MPFLILRRRSDAVLHYPLTKERITIGRDAAADLQLTDDTISRIHCELAWTGTTYRLTDKSKNRTRLNAKAIDEPALLHPNDCIGIGDWELEYRTESLPTARETVPGEQQPTLILKYDPTDRLLTYETMHLAWTAPDGVRQEATLGRFPIQLGGAPTNDIAIAGDPYISRAHCLIEHAAEGLVLRDAGSRNGTWWNGVRILNQRLPNAGHFLIGKTEIRYHVDRATETVKAVRRRRFGEMLGGSQSMVELFGLIERIAPSDVTVLVTGESGTGKELCARAIHAASPRSNKSFVALNCGALPATIIESELFGHERGAFTGASSQHRGVFEQAHGGTLFLDEIGEMSLDLQTRLLRVLETRTVRRVGGAADVPVDCRLIAATHQELAQLVARGTFREDLYYRLYVIPMTLPPLRERPEDIPLLIDHYCELFAPRDRDVVCTPAAREALQRYRWPGNVRELRNTVQRALVLAGAGPIEPQHLVFAPARPDQFPYAAPSLDDHERQAIVSALRTHKGNCTQAAKELGIARTTLTTKMRKYGIAAIK